MFFWYINVILFRIILLLLHNHLPSTNKKDLILLPLLHNFIIALVLFQLNSKNENRNKNNQNECFEQSCWILCFISGFQK